MWEDSARRLQGDTGGRVGDPLLDVGWMSAFLTGSAAAWIDGGLRRAGATLVVPPESVLIEREVPAEREKRRHELEHLKSSKEQRACQWAASIRSGQAVKREPGQ